MLGTDQFFCIPRLFTFIFGVQKLGRVAVFGGAFDLGFIAKDGRTCHHAPAQCWNFFMMSSPDELTLDKRLAMPQDYAELINLHPRDSWQAHRHFSDLTRFWLERHASFRQVFEELTRLSQAYIQAPDAMFAAKTHRYTSFILQQLEGHHMIEDQHYFPKISVLDERAKQGFIMLDRDHDALHKIIEGTIPITNDALRALQNSDTAGGTDPTGGHDARAEVETLLTYQTEFQRQLLRHLSDEEDLVVPVILEHGFTG
jgi:iron-sulfur cluster repair protein YtfE (RIC family)